MKRQVWITTKFEAYHKWEDAPDHVSFLRNLHRHVFKVKVTIDVKHDNRDIEFFTFKWWLEEFIKEKFEKKEVGSCEMIAEEIFKHIVRNKYPDRNITVEVSEDGENGAIVGD